MPHDTKDYMNDAATNADDALMPKHRAFVAAYRMCWNAAAAARAAGYSKLRARHSGYEVLKRADVRAAIDEWWKRHELDKLSAGLVGMLRASMLNYVRIDADGQAQLDLDKLKQDQLSFTSDVTVERRSGGASAPGGAVSPAAEITKMHFQLSGKSGAGNPARDARSGKGDGPEPLRPMTNHDRAKALLAILARAKAEQEDETPPGAGSP